jgi:Ni/Co efflux regulator RcnB
MHLRKALAVSTLAFTLVCGVSFAQDHHDQDNNDQHAHYVHHPEWKKGYHMQHDDWQRGEQVDWRAHRLHTPPAGYEWRLIDGNYVCANTSGVVFSVVVAK